MRRSLMGINDVEEEGDDGYGYDMQAIQNLEDRRARRRDQQASGDNNNNASYLAEAMSNQMRMREAQLRQLEEDRRAANDQQQQMINDVNEAYYNRERLRNDDLNPFRPDSRSGLAPFAQLDAAHAAEAAAMETERASNTSDTASLSDQDVVKENLERDIRDWRAIIEQYEVDYPANPAYESSDDAASTA